jgi:hypothetical protein
MVATAGISPEVNGRTEPDGPALEVCPAPNRVTASVINSLHEQKLRRLLPPNSLRVHQGKTAPFSGSGHGHTARDAAEQRHQCAMQHLPAIPPQARPFAINQFLSFKQDTVQIHKTKNQ